MCGCMCINTNESTALKLSKQNEMQNITRNGAVTKPKLISITCVHIFRRTHTHTHMQIIYVCMHNT